MTAISAMSIGNPSMHARPMATGPGSDGESAAHSSSISANDFLTLLVTEMKNQDPTAQTDPNEYVNQLVQVNSLEQLIEINENVSAALAPPGSGEKTQASAKQVDTHVPEKTAIASQSSGWSGFTGTNRAVFRAAGPPNSSSVAAGNLGAPQPVPAAQRVARSLSGFK